MPIRSMGFGLNFNRGFRPMGAGGSSGGGGAYSNMFGGAPGAVSTRRTLLDDPALELERMRQGGENFRAGLGADTSRYGADQRRIAEMFGAEQGAGASRFGAEQAAGASRFGAEQGRLGSENVARTQAEAAMLPYRLQHERFGTIFPFVQQQLGSVLGGLQGGVARPGGQSGAGPEITAGPVWTDEMIQQRVNATRGQQDQATAGRVQDMRQRLSARGFGSGSPLAEALEAQFMGQNLAGGADAERQIREGMAVQNAQQLLGSQQAREEQFANRQQEDIARRQPYFGTLNQLIGMLGSLA